MRVLILDGNNVGFRIMSAFTEKGGSLLTNSVGMPTTVIFGMLRTLSAFAEKSKVDKVIVCWDVGGGSKWRKKIFPNYKGNRTYKDMDDYFIELDACRSYLKSLGVAQAPVKGIEADDVIGWLAVKISDQGDQVIILSDDKDYYQLLRKGIKIFRPCKNEIYTIRDLKTEMGLKPKQLIKIDALVGQEKDFIPGACDIDLEKKKLVKFRFGPAKAITLLQAAGWDMKKAKRLLKQGSPLNEKYTGQLLKNWKQVLISQKLSTIRIKDKSYGPKERKKLKKVWAELEKGSQVRSKTALQLMRDLEIKTMDILHVLKSIGVEVKGKIKTMEIKT